MQSRAGLLDVKLSIKGSNGLWQKIRHKKTYKDFAIKPLRYCQIKHGATYELKMKLRMAHQSTTWKAFRFTTGFLYEFNLITSILFINKK